jgi:sugar (pentulose or hexulose) kinase
MNAGGKALDWFRDLFCSELSTEEFYNRFLPSTIESWLERESGVTYVPYLMGSRYSLEPLKAQLLGLTQQTTRDEILAAIIRGLCEYQKVHLDEIGKNVPLKSILHITGGATSPAMIRAKTKWMRDGQYVYDKQSSMKGAALLGLKYMGD